MYASEQDINILLKVQDLDMARLRAQRDFDQLPQRQAILKARENQADLSQKQEKILAMKADLDKKVTKVMVEDEVLQQKQKDVQAAIEAAGTDYRNLESRTKELAGHEKRRIALAEQLEQLEPQVSKVQAMASQVEKLLAAAKAAEDKAIAEFRQEGGALQSQIAGLGQQRQGLMAKADPELAKTYEKIAAGSGGVAIGLRNGERCGICRAELDGARLLDVKAQAPLAICPHCKRLLVV